ncbi:MAG: response regulator, partial [Ignavibacteria bacterium]|nr:response regulator [Ignavibacteria bacterium]
AVGLANARSLEQLENFVQELKRLNEEYQKQNKQILEQNDELKELHNQINEKAIELEKQRSKAVELTKVKSQFLASMSHELRTPLISILGLTELVLKDDITPNKSKERLGIVYRNGKKLLSMITNILEFSKLESGRIEIKKDNFLLNDLLDEIKQNIEPLTDEKKIKFTINRPLNKNFLINTDKSKIEQILNNLLTNAVKFTDAGEIQLTVDIENDNGLKISVKDTGIGISEENQQMIFSEFRQIDGSTSRKYGGAGLGLTITKRYIEMLGGNLSVKSTINYGSEFTFVLKDVVLDVVETPVQKFLTLNEEKNNLNGKSVLIYCSNVETKKFITDYLSSYNYNIIPFESGEINSQQLNTANQDTIIFCNDEHSPQIWQSIIDIKLNPATKDYKVIVISILEKEKVGWMLPLHEVLIKPLSISGINKTIDKIEAFAETKASKIFYVGPNKEEFTITFENEINTKPVIYFQDLSEVQLNRETLQVVIIDFNSFQKEALEFLFNVSRNKLNRNVYPIFYCSKDISDINLDSLNNELYKLSVQSKNHPLDVLKDLKDRLKIDESVLNQKQQLIEETEYDKYADDVAKQSTDSKYTVLIVDDDPDTLFTIGEIVKEMNYDTIFAHNGMECLVMLNHVKPDIILLDIMMPQMDGFETIKRIRSDNRFVSVPVVALTAYAMLDNKSVVTKNGFNDLVTKPVNSALLESKINFYLKSKVSLE